ncbi:MULTISPECIES: LysR family transcriptional regulator [Ramlibacter]|uniref:LysR family transcriptional regulator n=1 Tax=Ramlibacter pinisoli TaxID=2682844 RepID=A0A6N8ITB6_9BURK|nr:MULTISPECIES: LysR family transcriptional regulator [Ramlibacter]MBA2965159.1 LysR family transcriptional regulator [Ramlibacter sp. CGMCC 1.13660]MVQ30124.1 LysR family transcriptional regulator [Ramlibacter pinisoli]
MDPMHVTHAPDALRGIPMECLRSFEAAARTLNFTRAAAELHLTQSAVSRAIRTLEERLGTALFERHPLSVILTPAGRTLAVDVSRALDVLRESVRRAQSQRGRAELVVRVPRGLAVGWLFSRVAAFAMRNPEIDVRLALAQRVGTDADRAMSDSVYAAGSDFAIRLLHRDQAEDRLPRFLDEYILPCCAPGLIPSCAGKGLMSVQDVLHAPILEYDDGLTPLEGNWSNWCQMVGVQAPSESEAWLRVSDWQAVFELAARGKGVCLGRTPMVTDHLRSGALVAPTRGVLLAPHAYYLLTQPAQDRRVMTFASWLTEEVASQRKFDEALLAGRHVIDPLHNGSSSRQTRPGRRRLP